MKIEIVRTSINSNSITGDLYVDGDWCCCTLELPYIDNRKSISSIPEGNYGAILRYDHGDKWRLELTGTGNREHIQIHIGNYPEDIKGCIIVGEKVDTMKNAVLDSRSAYLKLKEKFYGTPYPSATPNISISVQIKSQEQKEREDSQNIVEKRLFGTSTMKKVPAP